METPESKILFSRNAHHADLARHNAFCRPVGFILRLFGATRAFGPAGSGTRLAVTSRHLEYRDSPHHFWRNVPSDLRPRWVALKPDHIFVLIGTVAVFASVLGRAPT